MTTKKTRTTVAEFKKELIASIQNEKRTFDMGSWTTNGLDEKPATCGTASCIAGHIESLRPRLAKKFVSKCSFDGQVDHADLASTIWEHETGEKCRFDFFGYQCDVTQKEDNWGKYTVSKKLEDITRQEAVTHINGRSRKWPLLKKDHGEYYAKLDNE